MQMRSSPSTAHVRGKVSPQERSVPVLMDVVRRLPDTDKDIKICAVVALGQLGEDHPSAAEARRFLVELLGDRRLDPLVASYAPTSLGKLGGEEALNAVHAVFRDRDADHIVRQSAALALGQLAGMEHEAVVADLIDYLAEGKDRQTRHFAIIALGQIGARDSAPELRAEAHDALRHRLGRELLGKGKSREHRSWAALAAALYARGQTVHELEITEKVRAAYDDEGDPAYKGAFAVALGLLGDRDSAPRLLEDFGDTGDEGFRGYAAVALGLLRAQSAGDALRGVCRSPTTPPTLRLQVSTGLGLMSDTGAVDLLVGTLSSARTLGVSSAAAKALGLIGDRDSIRPLVDVAADGDRQGLTRAFACVALGLVGERTSLPWNAALSANNNYRAKTPSVSEVLDIL